MTDLRSPEIVHLGWGEIEVRVAGKTQRFKDCRIWPGGAGEWDWNLTGTGHTNGIQPADAAGLVEKGAKEIILSRGQLKRLKVAPETREYLEGKNIPYHIEETGRAVELFNQLSREGRSVGGLFHSTC